MEPRQRYTIKKNERLKSRKAIEQLFKEAKSFSNFPFKVFWLFTGRPDAVLQTGFGVSAKRFKKAVDRNRIKRLMREAWRLQKNTLNEKLKKQDKQLSVFFIYVGNELPEYQLIFDKATAVVKRLIKITDENSVADT